MPTKNKARVLSVVMIITGALASIYFYLNKIERVEECGSACPPEAQVCTQQCVKIVTTETNPYLWVALPLFVIGIILFIYCNRLRKVQE